MNSAFVKCELITPLFSCGANQFNPEIRTTELKGLMRYMYRIACPTQNYTILRQNEAALFGGAADANSDGGHASPIRLSITNTSFKQEKCSLLYHKTTLLQGLVEGSFEIKLTHNDVIADTLNVNLDWYTKLLTLSLLLGGLGKRSRKGRGNLCVHNLLFTDIHDMMAWIHKTLNQIATVGSGITPSVFSLNKSKDKITPTSSNILPPRRPFITQIKYGTKLAQTDTALKDYLTKLDNLCHDTKDSKTYKRYQRVSTGSGNPRLASPLIISIVPVGDAYWPIYTFVQAFIQFDENGPLVLVDKNNAYRETFIAKLNS